VELQGVSLKLLCLLSNVYDELERELTRGPDTRLTIKHGVTSIGSAAMQNTKIEQSPFCHQHSCYTVSLFFASALLTLLTLQRCVIISLVT
jgi:hypothetical protein